MANHQAGPDYITRQEFKEEIGKVNIAIEKQDERMDQLALQQGITINELKHINKNTSETNKALNKFADAFSADQAKQNEEIMVLKNGNSKITTIITAIGAIVVAIIGLTGTVLTIYPGLAQSLFGQ